MRTGKGGSFKPGTAEANADRAAARLATFGSNKGYMGLGEWPQHNEEAARMDRIRDELNRDGFNAVREEGFWGDPNGEWVQRTANERAGLTTDRSGGGKGGEGGGGGGDCEG